MTSTTLSKPSVAAITVVGFLLVQSVCTAEFHQKHMEIDWRLERTPRNYIKALNGRRQAEECVDLKEVTASDGETCFLASGSIECRLWELGILFEDKTDRHEWVCSLNDEGLTQEACDGELSHTIGGYDDKVLVGEGNFDVHEYLESEDATSGDTILVLSKAKICKDHITVELENWILGLEDYYSGPANGAEEEAGMNGRLRKPKKPYRRNLAKNSGTMNTVVLRVNAIDNSPPPATVLSEDIFGDEWCIKSQYERCSYGKAMIQEYAETGGISDVPTAINAPGVVDININANAEGNTRQMMEALANMAALTKFGVTSLDSLFDLVIFCMPPGMGNWLAYAYIGRWDSYYNDDWCQSMTTQMHEVGHSIGLHHSGEYFGSQANKEYGDKSGVMGYSYNFDDTPKMCFNPAKNYQLGWYSDRHIDIDPNAITTDPTSYTLNGVVDYGNISDDAGVVLKIGDFYLGFNKATGFNEGTQEQRNLVTVQKKLGSPSSSTKSKLEAALDVGAVTSLYITDLLQVRVKYASNDNNKDAVIELNVVGDEFDCPEESEAEIVVELTTDRYFAETSWGIADMNGQFIFRKENYSSRGTFATTVGGICKGIEYKFIIYDSYGDGICCRWGDGKVTGTYNGEELFTGGEFGSQLVIPFTVSDDLIAMGPTENPSASPTDSFTANPTVSPTANPTSSPTANPTLSPIDLSGCVDDPNWLYRNKEGKNCTWIAEKSNLRTRKLCLRRANTEKSDTRKVRDVCKFSCDAAGIKQACEELIA